MTADGGNPRQITRLSTGASGVILSPDGKTIVFQSNVYPDCAPLNTQALANAFDDACNQRNLDADAKAPSKARVYTSLLYRHWTEWQTRRRTHLLAANIDGNNIIDLTAGPFDAPPPVVEPVPEVSASALELEGLSMPCAFCCCRICSSEAF